MSAPTLHTPRLTLRPMREADFPPYRDMMASPRSRYMGGPYGERGAWGLFCHDVACWSLFGFGALMVDLIATGETVGQVGISAGPRFPENELGWMLYEGFEGRGYATEAAAALRNWAFKTMGLETLVSYIDPANTPSRRVAERLGAVFDPDAVPQDPGDLVFRHHPS